MLGRISRYGRARARRPGPVVPAVPASGATSAGPVTGPRWAPVSRSSLPMDTGLLRAAPDWLRGGGHLLGDEPAGLLGGLVDAGLAGQDPGHHVLERVGAGFHPCPARVVGGDLAVARRLHHGAEQRVVAEHA